MPVRLVPCLLDLARTPGHGRRHSHRSKESRDACNARVDRTFKKLGLVTEMATPELKRAMRALVKLLD